MSLFVLSLVWIVTAVRVLAMGSTPTHRWVTRGLTFLAIASTLRDPLIQSWVHAHAGGEVAVGVLFQLGAPAIVFANAALYLAGVAWLGRRTRAKATYTVALLCSAVTLSAGIGTIRNGGSMEGDTSWTLLPGVSAFILLPTWCAAAILRACVAELRDRPNGREILAYGATCLLGVALILSNIGDLAAAAFNEAGQHNSLTDRMASADRDQVLYYAAAVGALAAMSPAVRGLERLELDGWSRRRRLLLPLWTDLTAGCPEIVHLAPASIAEHRTRYRLHRTIVEIRDCILILSRYTTPNPPAVTAGIAATGLTGRPADNLTHAVRLARAASAKARGESMGGDLRAQQSSARYLLDETHELAELARIWKRAKAIAHPLPS